MKKNLKMLVMLYLIIGANIIHAEELTESDTTIAKMKLNDLLNRTNKQIIQLLIVEDGSVGLDRKINVSQFQELRFQKPYSEREKGCMDINYDLITGEVNDELTIKVTRFYTINSYSSLCLTPQELIYIQEHNQLPESLQAKTSMKKFKNSNYGEVKLPLENAKVVWNYLKN